MGPFEEKLKYVKKYMNKNVNKLVFFQSAKDFT